MAPHIFFSIKHYLKIHVDNFVHFNQSIRGIYEKQWGREMHLKNGGGLNFGALAIFSFLIFYTAPSFFHSLPWQCSPFWRNQLPRWSWLWPRERWPSQCRRPRTEGSGQSGDGRGERHDGRLSRHNHNRPRWSPTKTPHHSEGRLAMPGQRTTSEDLQE